MDIREFAAEVVGHQRIRETLGTCLAKDQLHPSLIFSGPQGIGKKRLAQVLAQAVNCRQFSPDAESIAVLPCVECRSCENIASGKHADVQLIAPTEKRRAVNIAQIREMLEEMALKPVEGRSRVFIIEGADLLRLDAQNTLLKTLEEPPANTITILIAERANALISTIHSRCQHYRFRPLNVNEVEAVLRQHSVESGSIRELAEFSGGSPGAAIGEGGRDRANDALDIFRALAEGRLQRFPIDVAEDLIAAITDGVTGPEARGRLLEICLWIQRGFRDLLYLLSTGREPEEYLAYFLKSEVQKLRNRASLVGIQKGIEAVDRTIGAMKLNQNLKLSVEALIVELSHCL